MIFARNIRGVFYEHAHRLTGMFVGLTSLMMVVCVWRWNTNASVRILATSVFVFVCFPGVCWGGLRVTLDNLGLAVLHGVIGQLIFTGFVVIAAMLSQRWQSNTPVCSRKDQRWAFDACNRDGLATHTRCCVSTHAQR